KIKGGLPAIVDHDPRGDGRGDRGADPYSSDSDADAETALMSGKPVGDGSVKGRQCRRLSDTEKKPDEGQCSDDSERRGQKRGSGNGRPSGKTGPPDQCRHEDDANAPAITEPPTRN